MSKKIFAISTLLLVVVIAAIFVYNFAFKKTPTNTSATKISQEGKTSSATPDAQSPQKKDAGTNANSSNAPASDGFLVSAVSDEPVFGATLSADGNAIYYFLKSNGQLNQVGLSGKLGKVLSTEKYSDIKKIIWSKPKDKVIIKIEPSPGKSKFLYFDLATEKVTTLKENIDSVSWSNLGDKIIYKYYDSRTKKRTVSIADPDGSNWKDLANFNYQSVEIAPIPGSSEISFWPSPNAFTGTSVNTVTFSGGNQKEILKDKFGVDVLWSPDGTRAAVSFTDQKGGHQMELALMNSQGGQFQSLGFATFSSKCTWAPDSKFLYCALPGNISDSSTLPNDWMDGKLSTADTFWKIEASSGKKERLVDPAKIGGSFDALFPFLSQDQKTLFFVSKSDGKLYKLSLQ